LDDSLRDFLVLLRRISFIVWIFEVLAEATEGVVETHIPKDISLSYNVPQGHYLVDSMRNARSTLFWTIPQKTNISQ